MHQILLRELPEPDLLIAGKGDYEAHNCLGRRPVSILYA